jgi:hypothetical protein
MALALIRLTIVWIRFSTFAVSTNSVKLQCYKVTYLIQEFHVIETLNSAVALARIIQFPVLDQKSKGPSADIFDTFTVKS